MSTIHRVGIHFSMRTDRADKNGNHAIYVLFTHNGEKIRMSINHAVPKKKWNATSQKVIGTNSIAKGINNSIDITRAKIIDAVNTLSIQQKPVSLDLIRLILTENGEAMNHQKHYCKLLKSIMLK